jgi:hypothetical protein
MLNAVSWLFNEAKAFFKEIFNTSLLENEEEKEIIFMIK